MTLTPPRNPTRCVSIAVSAFVLLAMACSLCKIGDGLMSLIGVLFLLPFYGFPPIVSIVLARRFTKAIPQMILTLTIVLYGAWFAYIYRDAFHVNLDPQSGILMVWVGIYALPSLIPLWLISFAIERLQARR